MKTIKAPGTITDVHQQASDFIEQLKMQIDTRSLNLNNIDGLHSPSPLASDATKLKPLRAQINDLLFAGNAIAFNPYQYRIGNDGVLSADSAKAFASEKLTEQLDSISARYGLALVVTAGNESQFAENLQTIIKLLPFPEWIQTATSAANHAVLTIESAQIPAKRFNPYWRDDDYSLQQPLARSEQLTGDELAQGESVAESGVSPVSRLQELAAIQVNRLSKLVTDTNNFLNTFTGQCYAIKLTGTPRDMARQLDDITISSEPLSALFLMTSNDEPVFFYEMFEL